MHVNTAKDHSNESWLLTEDGEPEGKRYHLQPSQGARQLVSVLNIHEREHASRWDFFFCITSIVSEGKSKGVLCLLL